MNKNNYIKKIKKSSTTISDCIIGADISANSSLYDIFVTYYFENKLKIIKLDDMIKTVVLYDNTITLIVNPITLATCIYHGHIKITDVDEYTGQLTLERLSDKYSFKMGDTMLNINKSQVFLETIQCKIMYLRDIFMFNSDPLYIKIPHVKSIIPESYIKNKQDINNDTINETYHPKTLVYVIIYTSHSGKQKNTILIGNGANSKKATGYDFKNSKFATYIKVYADKLEEMYSYIYPMFWFSANRTFSNAKKVVL